MTVPELQMQSALRVALSNDWAPHHRDVTTNTTFYRYTSTIPTQDGTSSIRVNCDTVIPLPFESVYDHARGIDNFEIVHPLSITFRTLRVNGLSRVAVVRSGFPECAQTVSFPVLVHENEFFTSLPSGSTVAQDYCAQTGTKETRSFCVSFFSVALCEEDLEQANFATDEEVSVCLGPSLVLLQDCGNSTLLTMYVHWQGLSTHTRDVLEQCNIEIGVMIRQLRFMFTRTKEHFCLPYLPKNVLPSELSLREKQVLLERGFYDTCVHVYKNKGDWELVYDDFGISIIARLTSSEHGPVAQLGLRGTYQTPLSPLQFMERFINDRHGFNVLVRERVLVQSFSPTFSIFKFVACKLLSTIDIDCFTLVNHWKQSIDGSLLFMFQTPDCYYAGDGLQTHIPSPNANATVQFLPSGMRVHSLSSGGCHISFASFVVLHGWTRYLGMYETLPQTIETIAMLVMLSLVLSGTNLVSDEKILSMTKRLQELTSQEPPGNANAETKLFWWNYIVHQISEFVLTVFADKRTSTLEDTPHLPTYTHLSNNRYNQPIQSQPQSNCAFGTEWRPQKMYFTMSQSDMPTHLRNINEIALHLSEKFNQTYTYPHQVKKKPQIFDLKSLNLANKFQLSVPTNEERYIDDITFSSVITLLASPFMSFLLSSSVSFAFVYSIVSNYKILISHNIEISSLLFAEFSKVFQTMSFSNFETVPKGIPHSLNELLLRFTNLVHSIDDEIAASMNNEQAEQLRSSYGKIFMSLIDTVNTLLQNLVASVDNVEKNNTNKQCNDVEMKNCVPHSLHSQLGNLSINNHNTASEPFLNQYTFQHSHSQNLSFSQMEELKNLPTSNLESIMNSIIPMLPIDSLNRIIANALQHSSSFQSMSFGDRQEISENPLSQNQSQNLSQSQSPFSSPKVVSLNSISGANAEQLAAFAQTQAALLLQLQSGDPFSLLAQDPFALDFPLEGTVRNEFSSLRTDMNSFRSEEQSGLMLLRDEVLLKVMSFLPIDSLCAFSQCNKRLWSLSQHQLVWKQVFFSRFQQFGQAPQTHFNDSFIDYHYLCVRSANIRKNWFKKRFNVTPFTSNLHQTTVKAMYFHEQTNQLFTGSSDKKLKVWHFSTHGAECAQTLSGPNSGVMTLSLSSKNELIAGFRNGVVHRFSINGIGNDLPSEPGKKKRRRSEPPNKDKSLFLKSARTIELPTVADGFLFTNDTITWEENVKLWDEETAVQKGSFENHTKKVTTVIQLGPQLFATSSLDKTIKLFDKRTLEEILSIKAHTAGVTCLEFDGPHNIISGSNDRTVKIWDIRSLGKDSPSLATSAVHVSPVRVLRSGWEHTVSAGDDRSIVVWKSGLEQMTERLEMHPAMITSLEMTESLLFTGGNDGSIFIWDFRV